MRKILSLLFAVMIVQASQSQSIINGRYYNNINAWYKYRGVKLDSNFTLPTIIPFYGSESGSLYANVTDSSLYLLIGATWVKQRIDATGTSADSSIFATQYRLDTTRTRIDNDLNGKLNTGLAFLNADTAAKTWDWAKITGHGSFITNIPADSSVSINNRILAKQDLLVSGTNIKTINGSTILGSGDLVVSGGGGGDTRIYGSIYNKNTWSDLSDFTNNGSTSSVVSNKIQFTSGTGSFTQSLDLDQYTNLEKWKIAAKVLVGTKDATSYGFGLGVRSYNSYGLVNIVGRVNMSTSGTSGQLVIDAGSENAEVSTSTVGVSFSTSDYILLTVERDVDSLIISAFNYTTKSSILRTAYQWDLTTSPFIHNTGRFALFSFGGTFTVDSLSVESNEIKNAPLMVIGDSKTQGYNTTEYYNRYGYLLGKIYTPTVISAGGYDRTQDVINRLDEIVALAPKNVILAIGSNDIRSGVDSNTYKSNYDSIENRLRLAGINVWHTDLFYETAISQSVFRNYITRTYSSDSIIYTYQNGANWPFFLSADNIHPTDYGNEVIFNSIVSANKIPAGNKIYDYITIPTPTIAASGSNTQVQFNSSGALAATSNFTYNNSTNILGVTSASTDPIIVTAAGTGNYRTGITFTHTSTNTATFGVNNGGFGGYGASVAGEALVYGGNGMTLMAENSKPIKFASGGNTEKMRLDETGRLGIGVTSPTAMLHLKAGTATASTAPLKFTSGTNLTTPENGTVEYDGTKYFVTSGGIRYTLTMTLTGTAAPATTPASVGIMFVDTVNAKIYVSTGTSSSADWTILN